MGGDGCRDSGISGSGASVDPMSDAEELNGTLLTWRKRCEKQLTDATVGASANGPASVALDKWGLGFALRLLRIDVSDQLLVEFFGKLGNSDLGARSERSAAPAAAAKERAASADAIKIDLTQLFHRVWHAVDEASKAIASSGSMTPRTAVGGSADERKTETSAASGRGDSKLVTKAKAWLTK
eukprot:SAG31_NODE_7090_length_1791_cov_2.701537_1_plen_182_part_10